MEIPIACNLSDSELRERRETILKFFRQSLVKVRPLPLGLAFTFQPSSEVLTGLAELVDLERKCCPFLTFRIVVEAGDLPIRLEVTGTAAAKKGDCGSFWVVILSSRSKKRHYARLWVAQRFTAAIRAVVVNGFSR
jgi:hypothetical protein